MITATQSSTQSCLGVILSGQKMSIRTDPTDTTTLLHISVNGPADGSTADYILAGGDAVDIHHPCVNADPLTVNIYPVTGTPNVYSKVL